MCDFCKIIKKELDTDIVYETERNIVFLDYAPINEGHVLICPKLHADSIVDMPAETLAEICELIKKIVKVYEKEYGAKGYSVMQNGGECCEYGHFHVHVFPRYSEDGFGWTDSGKEYEHSSRVAALVRTAFEA